MKLCVVVLASAFPAILVAGCGQISVVTDSTGGKPTVNSDYDLDAAKGGEASDAPADSGRAPSYEGSPLCMASKTSGCYPDDPTTAKGCKVAPDGGAYDSNAGYDNAPLACRVQIAQSQKGPEPQPLCAPSGSGGDGANCLQGTDCIAQYECVSGNSCRHYCCEGNASCADTEFCDIQPMAQQTSTKVPVCAPMLSCKLLDDTHCGAGQTCAVVREDGRTSCVAVGGARAGDCCDTDHCGQGLVCLGSSGQSSCSHSCFQLCSTYAPSQCAPGQKCKGGLPLFPDPDVGICQ